VPKHVLIFALLLLNIASFLEQTQLPAIKAGSKTTLGNLPLAGVKGPQSTLVILVDFSDKPNSTSPTQIQSILQGLNDYYREDSYNMLSFQTNLSPSTGSWYLMPQQMTYYGADTSSSDSDLVHDTLQSAYNVGIDLSAYKFAIIVHAGGDEAMPPHDNSDIHSFTIPSYTFRPNLLTAITLSTSVVSETDPLGVVSHESGHLLGLPDLYDLTQRIDPTNNFLGYWDLMALGEWNPNNGNSLQPSPGTYPSQHSVWSKIQLGFVPESNVVNVTAGQIENVTIDNLETATSGVKAVKVPLAFNRDGTSTYYLLEMRAKIGTYDQYLPFASGYPGAGLLVYKVNESISNGMGSVRLVDAHPGGDLSDAPFGPCSSPCISNNTFWDQSNFVKIIVTSTAPTSYTVVVDRTSSPLVLLQVNSPSVGILVSVDGKNATTDSSKEVRIPVRYGPHTIYIQPEIPIAVGSTTLRVGLTDSFLAWNDGGTSNPRGLTVTEDIVITAIYRISMEPSQALALGALSVLTLVTAALVFHRRRSRDASSPSGPASEFPPASEGSPSFTPMESQFSS
jgi:M6 family metalloprotease-like protein